MILNLCIIPLVTCVSSGSNLDYYQAEQPSAKRLRLNEDTSHAINDYEPTEYPWYYTIADEQSLYDRIAELSHTSNTSNPLHFSTFMLQSILNWYRYKYPSLSFDSVFNAAIGVCSFNPWKIKQLLQLLQKTQINNFEFIEFKSIVDELAVEYPKLVPFIQFIYFYPFTLFISKNKLKYVSNIGNGHQAIVSKVHSLDTDINYALKTFHSTSHCLDEAKILQKIEIAIHSKGYSINVPRYIHNYNISCFEHKSILMQYIDGKSFSESAFTPNCTDIIWNQLSDTIRVLGSNGIGHFDINKGNILVDEDGNYWLIDFGFGIFISNDTKLNELHDFVIGTWAYYAPEAYQLSELLNAMKHNHNGIYEHQWSEIRRLIIDSNLYSLQALMFTMLNHQLNRTYHIQMVDRAHMVIERCWRENGFQDIDFIMHCELSKIWLLRKFAVEYYLKNSGIDLILKENHVNMLLKY